MSGKTLSQLLAGEGIIVVPGGGTALELRLAESAGFEAGYVSGYATAAAVYGVPDVGLIAFNEVEANVRAIRAVTSIPLIVDCDTGYGDVGNVIWDSLAFEAGLAKGNKILAVNGRGYDADALKKLIKTKSTPLKLLVKAGDVFRTVEIDYVGGLNYPTLEKIGKDEGWLDILLTPRG